MMNNTIKSQALEVNLSKTKIDYEIPENHLWLVSLSEKYWGINKRTMEFFKEFNHPYSNRKDVINLLVNVTINDFWIYKEHPECNRVLDIMLEIYDKLLSENIQEELAKHLVCKYLDFTTTNFDVISKYDKILLKTIEILDKNYDVRRFTYLSNIGYFRKSLGIVVDRPEVHDNVMVFMHKLLKDNIDFWKESTKIEKWYEEYKDKMSKDYSSLVQSLGSNFFVEYYDILDKASTWNEMIKVAFTFSDVIDAFRSKINDFDKITEQLYYIFYLLYLPGAVYQRDYLIIELNNLIKKVNLDLDEEQTLQSIDAFFAFFNDFKSSHLSLILDSILALGKEVVATGNKKIIYPFENKVVEFGFVSPGITYLTNDWELKVDPCHVKNIRVWLELIECNPVTMKKLLSALIINLRIGGIFIFDTDFFQKDITKLLNSNVSPVYKQIKQVSRIFPVYFNEIGAEGKLRDVSTKLDELSHRNDKLIHFLRKQIHTEGNNSHIQITEDIIRFWFDLNKNRLTSIVPENVFETVFTDGEWVVGVHDVLIEVCKQHTCTVDDLLEKNIADVEKMVAEINHHHEIDKNRVCLIIQLYQLLKEKYIFETTDITAILARYHFIKAADIEKLENLLNKKDNVGALKQIYAFMVQLNEMIFDPKISEGWENIFYKRHVAFGIPSMYGYYKEDKFDALGITFRLERVASILINNIVSEINTDYFTAKTLNDVFDVICLLRDGLSLDGIYDQSFDSNLKMFQYSLTSRSFTIRQYINIFQFMEVSIKSIITRYFIQPYDKLLKTIVPLYFTDEEKKIKDTTKIILQKSEVFYRELLSSAFIIQCLDNFISEILNNLRKQISLLSDDEIQGIMTYNPELVISPLYEETPTIDNQVFLGSKAYFLKKLYLNNYPIPEGFVITTEIFRRINPILKVDSLNNEIDRFIKSHIEKLEKKSGLKFGDAKKPLLFSVRSGAAISMPGAMNTFLNVGMNDEITENLSKQDNFAWTSWDCYRRLLQTWGMAFGLERNDFDIIINGYKEKYKITQKVEFTPKVMKEIAMSYKQLLIDNNIKFEQDPFKQVKQAIISVFNSWDTKRAKVYRQHLQIAEEWGTAVIIQRMIFGNLHYESGSGVLFTRDNRDSTSAPVNLTGDFSFLSQGEDIVAGLINTLPISEKQRLTYFHKTPVSLESAFPKIYDKLKTMCRKLIDVDGFGHQEIEFTFETANPEDLYILQTRNMAVRKENTIEVFATPENDMKRVGCGIGVGNKVLNGAIVFDLNDLNDLRKKSPGTNAVLVRPDTVPDDIAIIFECEGLLTGKGGSTSHAAVTAGNLGKTCVVNCDDMVVYEEEKKCIINGNVFNVFSPIAIDGKNGIIYEGNYPIKIQEL